MEKSQKCPNCSRNVAENEMYCYFCEMDIEELSKGKIKTKAKGKKNA